MIFPQGSFREIASEEARKLFAVLKASAEAEKQVGSKRFYALQPHGKLIAVFILAVVGDKKSCVIVWNKK